MKISIIVPVYNIEAYLPMCLDSLTGQDFADLEILCVNDGSRDGSLEILRDYARQDSRVKILDQENRGVSAARNAGLRLAQGEYILFVDGDDWIETNTCSKALRAAQETQADLVFWSYIREFRAASKPWYVYGTQRVCFDAAQTRQLHRRLIGLYGAELAEPQNKDSLVTVWGKLYRKTLLERISFSDIADIGTGEDMLFNVHAFARAQSACYLPELLYHYRKDNSSSLTTAYNPQLYMRWQTLFDRIEQYIAQNHLTQEYQTAFQNRIALSLIGLGVNIIYSGDTPRCQIRHIREILTNGRYIKAYAQLEMQYFPMHWNLFFRFARQQNAVGIYVLLCGIRRIIGR